MIWSFSEALNCIAPRRKRGSAEVSADESTQDTLLLTFVPLWPAPEVSVTMAEEESALSRSMRFAACHRRCRAGVTDAGRAAGPRGVVERLVGGGPLPSRSQRAAAVGYGRYKNLGAGAGGDQRCRRGLSANAVRNIGDLLRELRRILACHRAVGAVKSRGIRRLCRS